MHIIFIYTCTRYTPLAKPPTMEATAAAGRAAAGEWDDAQVSQFLVCDDFLMSMDNDTLQDLVLVPESVAAESDQPSQPPSKRARHPRPANEFAALMQRMGAEEDTEPANSGPPVSSDDGKDEPAGAAGGSSDLVQKTKTKPLAPQAAQKKACREKARREKLNEGCVVRLVACVQTNNLNMHTGLWSLHG